ncbi:hypothetical protein GCM10028795_12810 [Lysobacter olei]
MTIDSASLICTGATPFTFVIDIEITLVNGGVKPWPRNASGFTEWARASAADGASPSVAPSVAPSVMAQRGDGIQASGLPCPVAGAQRANLVLLDANPLQNISAPRRIYAVVLAGRMHDRTALDAMLAQVRAKVVQQKAATAQPSIHGIRRRRAARRDGIPHVASRRHWSPCLSTLCDVDCANRRCVHRATPQRPPDETPPWTGT